MRSSLGHSRSLGLRLLTLPGGGLILEILKKVADFPYFRAYGIKGWLVPERTLRNRWPKPGVDHAKPWEKRSRPAETTCFWSPIKSWIPVYKPREEPPTWSNRRSWKRSAILPSSMGIRRQSCWL